MRFFLTLFHNKHNFIGRTYSSLGHTLENRAEIYFSNMDEYVVFHTKLPIKNFKLIIEFALNERHPLLSTLLPCGWSSLDFASGALHSELREGSPLFLTLPSHQRRVCFYSVSYTHLTLPTICSV
eukprot:TRINITY_DN24435_c0_g1_i1.p1 TRINITY_DN24435_c0_g1~~TRINITY_DN24435_c0_g1_i1.p1  ORF type:complete len:125 (+),score=17.59 TRINITY_DN24435_c0_g1_i1:292-666(+)